MADSRPISLATARRADGRPIPPASAVCGAGDPTRSNAPASANRRAGEEVARGAGEEVAREAGGHAQINFAGFGSALPCKLQGEDLFLFFDLSSSYPVSTFDCPHRTPARTPSRVASAQATRMRSSIAPVRGDGWLSTANYPPAAKDRTLTGGRPALAGNHTVEDAAEDCARAEGRSKASV